MTLPFVPSKINTIGSSRLSWLLSYVVFGTINGMFVLKYTSRQQDYNEYLLTAVYLLVVTAVITLYTKVRLGEYYKPLFFALSMVFFVFTIYLNKSVDGYTLNVDRWSAMEVGIEALLNGEYPYSVRDHLNGRTSNLPSLIFIGMPFYLMGDVGLLQSFSFLLFAYTAFKILDNYKDRLLCLLLLVISPSYLWEIYVKSDLMSNLIIVLSFVALVQIRADREKKNHYLLLAFLSASLVLTRLIAVIPLSLLMFKKFYQYTITKRVFFLIASVLTATLFLYICLQNAGSLDHFRSNNPFELQNRQLPIWISFATILVPLFFSFKVTNTKSLIRSSAVFLLFPIVISFMMSVERNGLYRNVFESYFDISYFNIAMPFLLFSFVFNHEIMYQQKLSRA